MLELTTHTVHIRNVILRGFIQLISPMEQFSKHRLQLAKERLREKLTFEYITQLPTYKHLSREQYEKLLTGIEVISLLVLESFIHQNNL